MAALLRMLTLTISQLDKEDVKNLNPVLLQIFLTTLDYRATLGKHVRLSVNDVHL